MLDKMNYLESIIFFNDVWFYGFCGFWYNFTFTSFYVEFEVQWIDYKVGSIVGMVIGQLYFYKVLSIMKNNIKKLRNEMKISQKDLAQSLSVSRQTINAIETES